MTVLFGTSTSPTNVLRLCHVSKIYISIASVENKNKYIRLEDLFGIITDKSPELPNSMFVYVVEFEDSSKPLSLPVKHKGGYITHHQLPPSALPSSTITAS